MYTLYSGYHNATPGIDTFEASKVVAKIKETTSKEQFEALLLKNPSYDFKHYKKSPNLLVVQLSLQGHTALHMATALGNYSLAVYLIQKYGKECLNVTNDKGKTPIFNAIVSDAPQSFAILNLFINMGANVNFPCIDIDGCPLTSRVVTPLDYALEFKQTKQIKLLLKSGAEQGCALTDFGIAILSKNTRVLLDFDVKEGFFDKATNRTSRTSEILDQAKAEIYAEKFQFFLGLKDCNSIIKILSKQIVVSILFNEKFPNIRKKAKKMLTNAVQEMNYLYSEERHLRAMSKEADEPYFGHIGSTYLQPYRNMPFGRGRGRPF